MSPSRRACTIALGVMLMVLGASVAAAQVLGPLPAPLDFTPSPLDRSPRLVGLGGLVYVVEDENNEIKLWDFARNPAGLPEDRDSSSLEVWTGTGNAAGYRDQTYGFVHQGVSRRDFDAMAEAWHRSPGKLVYGFDGRVGLRRSDTPYDDAFFQRDMQTLPAVSPTLAGAVRWIKSGRLRFAVRGHYMGDQQDQTFRLYHLTPQGYFLGGASELPHTPNYFDANSGSLNGLGGGAALAYKVGDYLDVGMNGDYVSEDVETNNEGKRYLSKYTQRRPFGEGGLTLLGRLGRAVEYGVDGRLFRSSGDEKYYFTLSTGIARLPITARGNHLSADENGTILNTRVLVRLPGGLRLGGGGFADYRKAFVQPPDPTDPSSYNLLLNTIYQSQPDADSLALPDSVSRFTALVHAYEVGGGLSWESPGKMVVGVEYHFGRDRRDQVLVDEYVQGPYRKTWDVRAGVEYRCSERLSGRAGYVFRKDDADTATPLDETVGHSLTLGAGYLPKGASWRVEAGYQVEWLKSDFDDPTEGRGSNQVLGLDVRWLF